MTDAIVRANADLFGDTILIFNTEPYRVQTLVNATEAYVYGISTNIECSLGDRWGLTTGVTYTRGREINNSVTSPLAHIPPVYGSSVLTYTRDRFRIRGSVRFNGAKPLSEYRLGASDNEELATPDGALAWTVYSLFSSYELNQRVRIQLGIENLTDLHYRPFSAGVSAPGRNFILSVYWKSSNE
jgi:hemoglobin/transferrin/lactoferrin receptor protein